jgi:hypothetical protein
MNRKYWKSYKKIERTWNTNILGIQISTTKYFRIKLSKNWKKDKIIYKWKNNNLDSYVESKWDLEFPLPIRRITEPHEHPKLIDWDYFVFDVIVDMNHEIKNGYNFFSTITN